jgi:hypothetical protein
MKKGLANGNPHILPNFSEENQRIVRKSA